MTTDSTTTVPLTIDIVSDLVCRWCITGYKMRHKALDALPGEFTTEVHLAPLRTESGHVPAGTAPAPASRAEIR